MNQVFISSAAIGTSMMALSFVLSLFHVQIDAEMQADIAKWIEGAVTLVGGGRVNFPSTRPWAGGLRTYRSPRSSRRAHSPSAP